jgi:hypothetical protein
MKRDPILAAIEEYKHTWQRLETLGKEIGEFERASWRYRLSASGGNVRP